MNSDLFSSVLAQEMAPWSILVSTALLSWAVAVLDRRFANPIVFSLWFLGLATAAWVGGWSAGQINLGLVFLALPHVSVALLARGRTAERAEDAAHAPAASTEARPETVGLAGEAEADDTPRREAA